jgi:hypothetical protein
VHFPVEPGVDEAAIMRPDALQARLQGFLPTAKPFDIVGSNLYIVHQRVAKKLPLCPEIRAGPDLMLCPGIRFRSNVFGRVVPSRRAGIADASRSP